MLRYTPAVLKALGKAGKWLVTNKAGKTIPAGELGVRLGMDAMGAGLGALMTPGDIGDKAIAFGTDLGMSSVLGLGAGRLAGGSGMGATLADMAGSYAGAYGAMPVAGKLMQAKDLVMIINMLQLVGRLQELTMFIQWQKHTGSLLFYTQIIVQKNFCHGLMD